MKIAIVGPGAIGCVAGSALIEQARFQVTFCARESFSRLSVRYAGESVELAAQVLTDESQAQPVDWILLCVKAHQTEGAAGWLRALISQGSKVAVLQNGVEHYARMAPFVAAEIPIVPVIVRIPAKRTAPGEVTTSGRLRLTVPDTNHGREFTELFAGTRISAVTAADFVTDAWDKLCRNAVGGAITALTAQPVSVMRNPRIADLALQVLCECVAVARAEGAELDDSFAMQHVQQLIAMPDAEHKGNSMYYDRIAGRPLEYDARNAVIVRLGAKHGIPTPANAALVAL